MELVDSIMNWNLAFRQQRLESELAHFRKTARLREGQPLLLKQRQREFLLELELTDVSRGKDFV